MRGWKRSISGGRRENGYAMALWSGSSQLLAEFEVADGELGLH